MTTAVDRGSIPRISTTGLSRAVEPHSFGQRDFERSDAAWIGEYVEPHDPPVADLERHQRNDPIAEDRDNPRSAVDANGYGVGCEPGRDGGACGDLSCPGD